MAVPTIVWSRAESSRASPTPTSTPTTWPRGRLLKLVGSAGVVSSTSGGDGGGILIESGRGSNRKGCPGSGRPGRRSQAPADFAQGSEVAQPRRRRSFKHTRGERQIGRKWWRLGTALT